MYHPLSPIPLRSGETVEVGMIRAPDVEWRERIVRFLSHKGDIWNWQNHEVLSADLGMDVSFCVAHRGGDLISTNMTITLAGVGVFGHVYTLPAERGSGLASALVQTAIEDFKARGGKALFLDTGYGSTAYRIYERNGFRSAEPGSDYMALYIDGEAAFNAAYFGGQYVGLQRLRWQHWPSIQALFMGDFEGRVRAAPLGLVGRMTAEGHFLPLLRAELERQALGEALHAYALFDSKTQAVVGVAMWDWHPIWSDLCLIDVYCHPDYWNRANALLDALPLPDANRCLAYADIEDSQKREVLQQAGFARIATLPGFVRRASGDRIDVLVFAREAV